MISMYGWYCWYPPYSDHGLFFAIWVLVVHVLHPYVDDIIHINLSSQGLPHFWPLPMHDDPLRHSFCVRERFTRVFRLTLWRDMLGFEENCSLRQFQVSTYFSYLELGMPFKHIFFCGIVGSRCRLSFVFGSEVWHGLKDPEWCGGSSLVWMCGARVSIAWLITWVRQWKVPKNRSQRMRRIWQPAVRFWDTPGTLLLDKQM